MKQTAKGSWLLLYGLSCIVLLLVLALWGMKDRISLRPLLVTGGSIESLPAPFLVLTSVLSLGLALRLCQTKQCYKGWFLYSGLCLFLTGEEAGWGQESILGWQVLLRTDNKWDLHAWVSDLVKASLGGVEWNSLLGIILMGAGVTVVLGMLVLLTFKMFTKSSTRTLGWSSKIRLWQSFFLIGLILMIIATVLDLLDITGLLHGKIGLMKWALEESLELFGSVALLFAVVSRIHEEVQRSRSVTVEKPA